MGNGVFSSIGINPEYLIIVLFIIQIGLFVILYNLNKKYSQLKESYDVFLNGKDGKTLEKSFFAKFKELDKVSDLAKQNQKDIKNIYNKIKGDYQKVGIVKYDAFHEMGGNLSFALTMLDEKNNGWILNAMHSREGCYTYIKEVVNGECYIELAEEEKESLERAIFQEVYDIKDMKSNKLVRSKIEN